MNPELFNFRLLSRWHYEASGSHSLIHSIWTGRHLRHRQRDTREVSEKTLLPCCSTLYHIYSCLGGSELWLCLENKITILWHLIDFISASGEKAGGGGKDPIPTYIYNVTLHLMWVNVASITPKWLRGFFAWWSGDFISVHPHCMPR